MNYAVKKSIKKQFVLKKTIHFILILVLLSSCASVRDYNEQIANLHSPEELHKDVDLAYKKLKKLHPRLYQYISKEDLDGKFNDLKQSINSPMDSRTFYEKLAPVIVEVRQGHAGLIPPMKHYAKKERKAINKKKFEFASLNFEHLDNGLWIKSTLGEDSTVIGSRVLRIDNEPVDMLLDKYKKYFSSDGYNQTFYNKKAALGFYRFYYADKGLKDSLLVTLSNKSGVYEKMFRRIPIDSTLKKPMKKDSIESKKTKLTKAEKKFARLEQKQKQKENDKYGYIKSLKYFNRNFNFIGKDSSVAFMKIHAFNYGNYKDFYKEVFTKLDSAKTKNLIIDLRNNGGGRLEEIHEIYSYLTDKDFQFVKEGEIKTSIPTLKSFMGRSGSVGFQIFKSIFTPILLTRDLINSHKVDGKKYYRFKESKMQPPKGLNFKGNVYVIINGYSFSSSSVLTSYLQATNRAMVVGEESGGAFNSTVAGQTKTVTLRNSKVGLYFGMMVLETPFKTEPDGYGVKPDVEVIPTAHDRANNIDPELEWILNHIKK